MRMLVALILLMSSCAFATIDAYEFKSPDDEQRFRSMVEELRCPKCQNQNIADSNAGLAKDIKDRVHDLVNEGKSNSEIRSYMVERYGNFITYRPPFTPATWFLYLGPFLLATFVAVALLVRKLSASSSTPADSIMNVEQHKKVDEVLKKLENIESK